MSTLVSPAPTLADLLARLATAGRGAALLARDGDLLRPLATSGLPASFTAGLRLPVRAGAGANGTAAALGQQVVVPDTRVHPSTIAYFNLLASHRLLSIYSLPIFDQAGEVAGTLALYGREPGVPVPDEVEAMRQAAQQASDLLADQPASGI